MATAIQKLMNNPKAQAAIKSRASALATRKTKEAVAEAKAKFKKIAPAIKRDVIDSHLMPAAIGAGGAIAADMLMKRLPAKLTGGARGDVIYIAAGIGAGVLGRKVIKSPHLISATLGIATIGLYKLASRVVNRAGVGALSGLLSETHDMDLAGYPGMQPVSMQLSDGSMMAGLQDGNGALYGVGGEPMALASDGLAGTFSQAPYVPASQIG
ncbi:hypothetical protein [Nevskia ramosa]|uniref:hypothetical protein n=1 Tax=Nevskia ramosa TaxID=64002 RepID=UPI0003B477E0|nr:hypothetical protein [Nevskia ramosa]